MDKERKLSFPLHLSVSLPLALWDVDDYVGGFSDARCLIVHHIFTFIQKLSQWDVGDNVGGLSDAGRGRTSGRLPLSHHHQPSRFTSSSTSSPSPS